MNKQYALLMIVNVARFKEITKTNN